MTAEESLRRGDLEECLDQLRDEIRGDPANVRAVMEEVDLYLDEYYPQASTQFKRLEIGPSPAASVASAPDATVLKPSEQEDGSVELRILGLSSTEVLVGSGDREAGVLAGRN